MIWIPYKHNKSNNVISGFINSDEVKQILMRSYNKDGKYYIYADIGDHEIMINGYENQPDAELQMRRIINANSYNDVAILSD